MAYSSRIGEANLPSLIVVTGLFGWGAIQTGPFMVGGHYNLLPTALAVVGSLAGLRLAVELLMRTARIMDWVSSYKTTGKGGTAKWASRKQIHKELNKKKEGHFWGLMVGRRSLALFADFVSNAMSVAPAGSGKGIYTVIPALLSIRHSKVVSDFKGELVCIVLKALQALGQINRILNPGSLWQELIGIADSYNPLDIIVDDLRRPGGLRDVPDDLRELSAQLYPEPAETQGDNTYWREGSRRAIADAILLETMIEQYDATLSSVALLIEDRDAFERNLRWVVGVDLEGDPLPEGPMPIEQTEWASLHDPEDLAEFIKLVRSRARNLLALMTGVDSRTFDSFISGAQQALAPFAFGRLAPAMRRSTFSMNDLKEGDKPTNLFIVADASRMEGYKAYIGLIQWCAMTAIKRHSDKARPVYFIMDEATNYKIHALESLLTWGRSYGLRLHLIFQDLSAFERVYGKQVLETLLSETEIKQFLPGQRSPKTLELIEKLLGEQSVMAANLSSKSEGMSEQTSESGRALMTADEIRRSRYGLLLVRQLPPIKIEPISYAEVEPWRKQADINPFHGKPFLKKVRLKL
ncbi:MAG: hypothetical protein DBP01_05205 [gamma proteobacterium symbiont of Ctena orbiculata]|nr:MAG: hypothetical protein DBP01_05205 [gamma proteobacterium symbiont of Ctena orbiculata]